MMDPPFVAFFDCRKGNIRQKRRDYTALRGTFVCWKKERLLQHAGLQELSDHTCHLAISDARTNALHQQTVIDMIEATLDVSLNDPLIRRALASAVTGLRSWTYRHADMLQGRVTASARSKPVRDMPERGLEDRLQQVLDRTLHEAIGDSRDGLFILHLAHNRLGTLRLLHFSRSLDSGAKFSCLIGAHRDPEWRVVL